jgi:hypothetical protein
MLIVAKIFLIFTLIECSVAFFSNHHEPEVVVTDDLKSSILNDVRELWISQKLDHFDEKETRVWDMRYLQNDGYLSEGE